MRLPSSLGQEESVPQLSPPRLRRQAKRFERPRAVDPFEDDDSADEREGAAATPLQVFSMLRCTDPAIAQEITFEISGIHVVVEGLEGYRERSVRLSHAAAMRLAGGVAPEVCVALQSGQLAPLRATRSFHLQRADFGWRLVANSGSFFNFQLHRWQPLSSKAAYSPVTELLYVAFSPALRPRDATGALALFVKLGYRELAEDQEDAGSHDSLVGYIEKKSDRLRITNVPGAGVFVFRPPPSHCIFARPCRAAEASLKTHLLHSGDVVVTPSGHCGEVGTFSASLEYFFVEPAGAAERRVSTLAALAHALRDFTGNQHLMPVRAGASSGGGLRRGCKRLLPWCRELSSGLSHGESRVPQGPASRTGFALRSRYKRARLGCGPAIAVASHRRSI